MAPTFEQKYALALYELSTLAEAGLPDYWAGYRPSAKAKFGKSAAFDQVWEDAGGVYLFLNQRPSGEDAFAAFLAALDSVLPSFSPAGDVRFLWIADPMAPPGIWNLQALRAALVSGAWQTSRAAMFELGEYGVSIDARASLKPADPAALGYGVAIDSARFMFVAPSDGIAADAGSAWLPLAGAGLGALHAKLTLAEPDRPSAADRFQALRVAVRYAAPTGDGSSGSEVVTLDMAVMKQGPQAVGLQLRFDPLNPLAGARSHLELAIPAGPAQTFESAFRTDRGCTMLLAPRAATPPLGAARLVFCRSPLFVTPDPESASWTYHLAPDGAFQASVRPPADAPAGAGDQRVMLGLSGTECVESPAASPAIAFFQASQAAYAPSLAPDARPPAPGDTAPLPTSFATTAWATFLAPAEAQGLTYFAQPRQAPLFTVPFSPGVEYLQYMELPAGRLPSWRPGDAGPPATVPVAPYAGAAPGKTDLASLLERAVLAPARRAAIVGSPPALPADTARRAVTPQGLLMEVAPGRLQVVIANLPGSPSPWLAFTRVGPKLQSALQADQLFFVVANREVFLRDSDGQLTALIGGWTFRLSPEDWRTDRTSPTLMLFKYANRPLEDLARDSNVWGWREAGTPPGGTIGDTQKFLDGVFSAAARRAADPGAPADDPRAAFYRTVVRDPAWNGVLFLNAPIDIQSFPPELQFVTAGIDLRRLAAHHVGFSATTVHFSGSSLDLGETAAFALVDYEDPSDLYLSSDVELDFKTLNLTAQFANSALQRFSARTELMMNRMFGVATTKLDATHGNNLVLAGSCQVQDGSPAYKFVLEGRNRYSTARSALESIDVSSVRLHTLSGGAEVTARFVLAGDLRFVDLPGFDPFCYGPALDPDGKVADGCLRFADLAVTMTFPSSDPSRRSFAVDLGSLSFDLTRSRPRPRSLAQKFPVTLKSLVSCVPAGSSKGDKPEDIGFTGVAAPVDQARLEPPWFGLLYDFELGTFGALAGSAGIKVSLLVGWCPGEKDGDQPVYLGVRLPGSKGSGIEWPLQGVIRLGFRNLQFVANEDGRGGREYMLRLRRFALSFLGFSFPPGNVDLVLFGDPGGAGGKTLGWYAAYAQERKKKEGQVRLPGPARTAAGSRRLRSGRRSLPPASGL